MGFTSPFAFDRSNNLVWEKFMAKREMQYAVWQMPHSEKDLAVLVDAAELPILDHGEDGVLNTDTPSDDDHLKLKLVCGVLMSNNLRGL